MFDTLHNLWSVLRRRVTSLDAQTRPLESSIPAVEDPRLRYHRRAGVVAEALGPGLVLLDLDRCVAFRLNGTGQWMWESLREAGTREEITQRMVVAFGRSRAELEPDVRAFFGQLIENRLLEPVSEEAP